MVNLHKSKTNDQNKKKALKFGANVEIWLGKIGSNQMFKVNRGEIEGGGPN
jgi:hypothetical protein